MVKVVDTKAERNKVCIYALSQIIGMIIVIISEVTAVKTTNIHIRAIAVLFLLITVLINVFEKGAYKCRRALATDKGDKKTENALNAFYLKFQIIFRISALCQIGIYLYYFLLSVK